MSCVPDPCQLIGDADASCFDIWCNLRCNNVTNDSLYSVGYILASSFPIVVQGIPDILESDLSTWLFQVAIMIVIPYVTTFIVLFLILMGAEIISASVGLLLMVLVVILAMVSVFWIVNSTSDVVHTIVNSIQTQVQSNIVNNKDSISRDLFFAVTSPDTIACRQCPKPCIRSSPDPENKESLCMNAGCS